MQNVIMPWLHVKQNNKIISKLFQCFITGRNAGVKITHGVILQFFCPAGTTRSTDYRQIWHIRRNQKSPMPCQISCRSVHMWGFLVQKTSKACKLIHPDIHEICNLYAPIRSTKMFQIWCHSVLI